MLARCGMSGSLPGTVPEACPPHRECQRPSAWRAFFVACGLPDILERSPRGERQHGSETSPLPDGGPGQTLLKVRNGIRLPCRSITDRMSDEIASRPRRPATATERARCRTAPVLPPGVVRFPAPPSLPVSLKYSPLCRDSVPPYDISCQPYQRVCTTDPPLHRRKALSHTFQRYSRGPEARVRKKLQPPCTPPLLPLLSSRMACLTSNSRQTTAGTAGPT